MRKHPKYRIVKRAGYEQYRVEFHLLWGWYYYDSAHGGHEFKTKELAEDYIKRAEISDHKFSQPWEPV